MERDWFRIFPTSLRSPRSLPIRARESVSPSRVDEMRNHREPRMVYDRGRCERAVRASSSFSLDPPIFLSSISLAYPSMDTSLPGSLTPVERFGFLSSYLTITRTWGQKDSLPPCNCHTFRPSFSSSFFPTRFRRKDLGRSWPTGQRRRPRFGTRTIREILFPIGFLSEISRPVELTRDFQKLRPTKRERVRLCVGNTDYVSGLGTVIV